ncbi:Hypothetical protein FKW44_004632 [Caligus rogercresseyi]|uniref:Uncharacterized protein n=1 Tax=Caligus rogercresseyi TaxID=217165 RepID=A0A7T8KA13_CALRO|nr:Hypothetical protein FKW44_004632 [Caligus rogercresseyi]
MPTELSRRSLGSESCLFLSLRPPLKRSGTGLANVRGLSGLVCNKPKPRAAVFVSSDIIISQIPKFSSEDLVVLCK